jgi:hypothetical protein
MSYSTSDRRKDHLRGIQVGHGLFAGGKILLPGDEFPAWLTEACEDDAKWFKLEYRPLTRRERRYAAGKGTKL